MPFWIVVESMFGNTRRVAEHIAATVEHEAFEQPLVRA
jgi:flavodoxin